MPKRILHLPDEFYFNRFFDPGMIGDLIFETGSLCFPERKFQVDVTANSTQFHKNVSIRELTDFLEDKATLVNTITLTGPDPSGSLSIVLFLTDMFTGYEASFTITSKDDRLNAHAAKIITDCIEKKYELVRKKAASPHYDWLKTPETLLKQCWDITKLRDLLLTTQYFIRQDQHYFVSDFFDLPAGLLRWDEFVTLIIEPFYYTNPSVNPIAEMIDTPPSDPQSGLDRYHLIRYLIRNKKQKTSFQLIQPTGPKTKGKRALKVDLIYHETENGTPSYKLRFMAIAGSVKWASEVFRRAVENLLLELDQFTSREGMAKTGELDDIIDTPAARSPKKYKTDIFAGVRINDLPGLLFQTLETASKSGRISYHLSTPGQKDYFFSEAEKGKLRAIYTRKGATHMFGLKVLKGGYTVRASILINPQGRHTFFILSDLPFNHQNERIITRAKERLTRLQFKQSGDKSPVPSKTRESDAFNHLARELSRPKFFIKSFVYKTGVTTKKLLDFVSKLSAMSWNGPAFLVKIGYRDDTFSVYKKTELQAFHLGFQMSRHVKEMIIECNPESEHFYILSVHMERPKEIFLIHNLEPRHYKALLKPIRNFYTVSGKEQKQKNNPAIRSVSKGQFVYPKQFPRGRWVSFFEELEALLPHDAGYHVKLTSVKGHTTTYGNREVQRITANLKFLPQSLIKLYSRGLGNDQTIRFTIDAEAARETSKGPNGKYTIILNDPKKLLETEALILRTLSIVPPNLFSSDLHSPKVKTRLIHNFSFRNRFRPYKFCNGLIDVAQSINKHKTMMLYFRYKGRKYFYKSAYASQKKYIARILREEKGKIDRIEVRSPAIFGKDVNVLIKFDYKIENYEHFAEIELISPRAEKNIDVRNRIISIFPK